VQKKQRNDVHSPGNNYTNLALLGLLLALIAPKLYSLHLGAHSNYDLKKKIVWSQSETLAKELADPISNTRWQIDFSKIEQQLWNSNAATSKGSQINAETLQLLEQIYALLPENIDAQNSARVGLLINKSLTSSGGIDIAALLGKYQAYRQKQQENFEVADQTNDTTRLAYLLSHDKTLESVQARHFGELAQPLFNENNVRTHYFNQRLIVSLSPNLTDEQKAEQLEKLKQGYRASLSNLVNH